MPCLRERTLPFVYLLSADPQDLQLAQAELWAMTGCEAQGMLGYSQTACDISRSAYTAACGELVAEGDTLQELCTAVHNAGLAADGFRIDMRDLPPKTRARATDVARRVADEIDGWPNLDAPKVRFLVVATEGHWRLVRLLSTIRRDYLSHSERPCNLSIALSARHARALVNLVAAPGDLLWDPFCGVGTSLIEAGSMGVRTLGSDANWRHVGFTEENLRHFGLPARVMTADARTADLTADAVIVDFPYGHVTHVEAGLYAGALNNLASRALRLAVITSRPEDALFSCLDLRVQRCAVVAKHRLARHFYVLAGRRRSSLAQHSTTREGQEAE